MIELYKVSKTVPSGAESLTILHALDLTIPDGQFVAVVGPSGSGKSTLLGLIAGLDAPTSGEIRIDGQAITRDERRRAGRAAQREARLRLSVLPSDPFYDGAGEHPRADGDCRPPRRARARAQLASKMWSCTARAHHYPSQLSGGEQQRVAIARAFANEPSIMLADEPTGNLDSRNGRHVFDLMVEMNRRRGTTLVLVTHDHELAGASRPPHLSARRPRRRRQRSDEAREQMTKRRRADWRRRALEIHLQMARRELRASWRRLLFFFLCIGIGVGTIVALRSMIQNVNRAVAGEARG